jgi:aspartyl-tRNA synthetase
VPGGAQLTRKQTDGYAEWVKQFGAGGLPITKVVAGGQFETGIAKFIQPVAAALIEKLGAEGRRPAGFGVDAKPTVVHRVLGELRQKIARDLA